MYKIFNLLDLEMQSVVAWDKRYRIIVIIVHYTQMHALVCENPNEVYARYWNQYFAMYLQ